MKIRPSGLLVKDNQILFLKYNYSGNEVFALPGGNQENQDGLSETLAREFEEELNLKISVNELVFVAETLNNKGVRILHLVFKTTCDRPNPIINPAHTTCLGFEWVGINQLQHHNLYPNLGKEIQAYLNGERQNIHLGEINQQWF